MTKVEDVPSRRAEQLRKATLMLPEFRGEIAVVLEDKYILQTFVARALKDRVMAQKATARTNARPITSARRSLRGVELDPPRKWAKTDLLQLLHHFLPTISTIGKVNDLDPTKALK